MEIWGTERGPPNPQARNNKGNVINLDPSHIANPHVATAEGPFKDGSSQFNAIGVWVEAIPSRIAQPH